MAGFKFGQPGGISVEVQIPDELFAHPVGVKQYPFDQPLTEEELSRMIALLYTNLGIALTGVLQREYTTSINIDALTRHVSYAGMKILYNNKSYSESQE